MSGSIARSTVLRDAEKTAIIPLLLIYLQAQVRYILFAQLALLSSIPHGLFQPLHTVNVTTQCNQGFPVLESADPPCCRLL